jgi:GAF domain-containing protein
MENLSEQLQNTRLYQAEQQARQHESFLAQIGAELASSIDFETTLQNISRILVPELADYIVLDLLDETGRIRRGFAHHYDPQKIGLLHELDRLYRIMDNPNSIVRQAVETRQARLVERLEPIQIAKILADEEITRIGVELATRSFISTPLIVHNHPIGVLTLALVRGGNRSEHTNYTRSDLGLVEEIGQRIAVALENARLYQQSQQARTRLEHLHTIAVELAGAVSKDEVQRLVLSQFQQIAGATSGTIMRLTEDGAKLEVVYAVGYPQQILDQWQTFPVNSPVPIAECVREKRAIFAESLEKEGYFERFPVLFHISDHNPRRALVALPLLIEERVIGAIGLSFQRETPFSPQERQFMLTLAGQCALALERARLYEAEQQAYREQALLNEVSTSLAQSLDYKETLQNITHLLVPRLGDYCTIYLLDKEEQGQWVANYHFEPNKIPLLEEFQNRYDIMGNPKSPLRQVLLTQKALLVETIEPQQLIALAPDQEIARLAVEIGVRSLIIVPLVIRQQVIGAITLAFVRGSNRTETQHYTKTDLALAEEIAGRVAVALENARLYQQSLEATERTGRLQAVTAALSQALTLEEVTDIIINQCFAALNAQTGSVALLNPAANQVEVVQSIGYSPQLLDQWRYIPLDHPSPLAVATRTGETLWLGSYTNEVAARFPDLVRIHAQTGNKALAALPLIVENRIIGAISLSFNESQPYGELERNFVLTLTQLCAQALERARLYHEEQQSRKQAEQATERISRLQKVTAALSKVLTAEQVATIIVEEGLGALNANAGFVALLNKDGTSLEMIKSQGYTPDMVHGFQIRPYTGLDPASEAARTGQPIWLESFETFVARYPHLVERQKATGNKAVAALPLVVEERVLGVVGAGFKEARTFSQKERDFMLALIQQCAQALERANLYQQTQKALETQQELDNLKDLFISVASHELRNPLASIKGFGQLLQRQLLNQAAALPNGQERRRGQDKLLRLLENILRQTNRMNELVRQLLDFSRLQNDKLELNFTEDVNLVELVAQVIEEQQAATENRREIELQTDLGAIIGKWDSHRLEQVLTNLISNALKYSPSDKPVVVGVEERVLSTPQEGGPQNSSELREAVVWIKDEGQGISPDHQAHLFDRFYRVRTRENARVEGLGLGLYISYEIVKQHGGRMWLESEVRKGSIFYFSLPLRSRLPR